MRQRRLGRSDLMVSEIALGSWLTYSGGVAQKQAEACVRTALEAGINFFDTANVYGRGASETFLGQALKTTPRASYILATKLYFPMSATDHGLSRAQIFKQVDASLARLQTDYVDLYQCHRFDEATPLEETMEALTRVVAQGKARYVGFSEWPPAKIRQALAIPKAVRFISSQPQYSMLWRAPEREVIPLCAAEEISQIVWSPLAQGVLTGKYVPGKPPPSDSRAASETMNVSLDEESLLNPRVLSAVQALQPIARDAGLTMAQLALAWLLREPNVAAAIIGASRPEQVLDNTKASGIILSPDVLRAIDHVLEPVLSSSNV